jgi:dolichyl-phosphate beta-glucosyltransferase
LPKTILVIPCFNEERRLDPEAFRSCATSTDGLEFLFVNDGSRDRTSEILDSLAESPRGRCSVHSLPENRGKAEAVRQGFLKAQQLGSLYIGMWDADLATPLNEIPRFVEIMDAEPGILLATGARVRLLGRCIERSPARHYVGRCAASLISIAIGQHYYDTQCGAKLMRNTAIMRSCFAEPFCSRWIFDVELILRLKQAMSVQEPGLEPQEYINEIPLLQWRHKRGSKIKPNDYLLALLDLWRLRRNYF